MKLLLILTIRPKDSEFEVHMNLQLHKITEIGKYKK